MLLLRLHRLALQLRPFLPWCYAIGCGGAALAFVLLFGTETDSQLLGLALGVTIWALLLFAFIRLFQAIPPPVLPKDSFFERLRSRCRLAFYHLLALGIVLLGLALAALTLKLLSSTS